MNRVIAVFSPAGGTGVSTIATHLAYKFADKFDTALLDMHPDFGSIAKILKFNPSLPQDRFPVSFKLDSPFLEDLAVPQQSRLKFFPAPPSTVSDSPDWKNQILNCRKTFAFTILDLPSTFLAPELGHGLETADLIIISTEYLWPRILSVRNFLDSSHDAIRAKSKVIINKTEWLPPSIIEESHKNLGCEPFAKFMREGALEKRHELKIHSQFCKNMKSFIENLKVELMKPE